mmetsp:Transcript_12579/g.15956  ORF Transcript_12579/g.15956 Transcript_12579/m.15956 type:complete len:185 (-) Transcript_12579:211-765(-)
MAVRRSLAQFQLKKLTQLNFINNIGTGSTCKNHNSKVSLCQPFSSQQQLQQQRGDIPEPSGIYNYDEDIKTMTNDDLSDVTTIPGFTTLIHSMPKNESTPRNALVGKVVSDKMQKTVNVAVDRYRIVPKYRKRKKYTKKFFAHDEKEVCHEGDLVMIVPCHRISKNKHFMVHEIIKRKGMFNDE